MCTFECWERVHIRLNSVRKMEEFLSEEAQKAVKTFRKKHPSTNAIQGVLRLPKSIKKISKMIKLYTWAQYWTLSEEQNMDGDVHYHFVIYNKKKKIPISHFRKYMKEKNSKIQKWTNGMMNITRVEDSFKILCYILKEQKHEDKRTWRSNQDVSEIKLAMDCSYKKVNNMSRTVLYLYKQVQLRVITPKEATKKYISLRNDKVTPDANWTQFAKNCEVLSWDKERISSEVERYFQILYQFDNY